MTQKQKSIEIKSLRERVLLTQLLSGQTQMTDIEFTPYDGADEYDFTAVQVSGNDSKTIIGEAKVRMYPSTYPSWMIEKKKYDSLMKYKDQFDKILYINFFSDGGCIIWDLKTIREPNWQTRTLLQNNYDSKEVEKEEQDIYVRDSIQQIKPNKFNVYEAYREAEEQWQQHQLNK